MYMIIKVKCKIGLWKFIQEKRILQYMHQKAKDGSLKMHEAV